MIILFFARVVKKSRKEKQKRREPKQEKKFEEAAVAPEQDTPSVTPQANDIQSLRSLNSDRKIKQEIKPESSTPLTDARTRINRMPELKRAVIWAEILGKPKGLD